MTQQGVVREQIVSIQINIVVAVPRGCTIAELTHHGDGDRMDLHGDWRWCGWWGVYLHGDGNGVEGDGVYLHGDGDGVEEGDVEVDLRGRGPHAAPPPAALWRPLPLGPERRTPVTSRSESSWRLRD